MAGREAVRPQAVQEVPATGPGDAAARDRSAQPCLPQGWSGSLEHPPPAGRERRLVGRRCGLHAGGEEQGTDRHPALQAGIHLAWRLDPVGQLTGANEGRGEDDLAREQAMGDGRSEQPQQGVHETRERRDFWLLPKQKWLILAATDHADKPHRRSAPAPPTPRKGLSATRVSPCAVRKPGQSGGVIASTKNGVVTPQPISVMARRKSIRGIEDSTEGRGAGPEALQICLGTKPSALKMGL